MQGLVYCYSIDPVIPVKSTQKGSGVPSQDKIVKKPAEYFENLNPNNVVDNVSFPHTIIMIIIIISSSHLYETPIN